jgi:type VI secretion system protein ImpC
MINARIAQIDHLLSIQINEILHHAEFQRSRRAWRGLKYLLSQSETGPAQDQGAQRLQEGAAARPAARARVRPERAVQEGLRGGVRRLRRHAVRRARRRLLLRQERPGHRAAREGLERGRGGARAVPDGGRRRRCSTSRASRSSTSRATWRRSSTPPSTRSGRRSGRPRTRATWRSPRRACSLREPYGSATVPIEAFNYEERVDGTDTRRTCGATRRTRWRRTSTRRSRSTAGAPPSAASRAAGWSRGCRCTTSAPRRASW